MKNNYLYGFSLVVLSGLIWSFGVPMVRYLEDAENYRLPYLFYRGMTIFMVVFIYVIYREKSNFINSLKRLDGLSYFGGLVLSLTMFGWIYSLTTTTVAITMLMLAVAPVLSAFLGYLILGEGLSRVTKINMIIVAVGVFIMVAGSDDTNTILGAIYGFFVALGFAVFTITLRKDPSIPKLLTPGLAGIFGLLLAAILIILNGETFEMPQINIVISVLHGLVVAVGMILYSLGARYLPSGELVLLSLFEVVAGIIWCWLPILGINEVPGVYTISGGVFILSAIVMQGIASRKQQIIPMP